jgi:hypothetical protein
LADGSEERTSVSCIGCREEIPNFPPKIRLIGKRDFRQRWRVWTEKQFIGGDITEVHASLVMHFMVPSDDFSPHLLPPEHVAGIIPMDEGTTLLLPIAVRVAGVVSEHRTASFLLNVAMRVS